MRASFKNTSMALLVTLALSLFFVYAMRPQEAAGSEINQHSYKLKNSSSSITAAGVTLGITEGIKTEDSASAMTPSGLAMRASSEGMADGDLNIVLNSATSNQINTQVASVLTSEDNTQHRVEYYTSSVCGDKGLENPLYLGALNVKTNNN